MANRSSITSTTVSAAFVRGLLSGCEARGWALSALLEHAEIAIGVLDDPNARVALPRYAALYNHVTAVLDDEGFGLFSSPMRCGSFAYLCRSVLHAATLGEALPLAIGFLRLVLPDFAIRLQVDGERAQLLLSETRPLAVGRVFAYEWLLRLLHGLACWLVDRSLVLERVDFPYARPAHFADYALIYTADSRFNAPALSASFRAEWLALPIRRDQAALRSFLVGAPGRISTLYRRDRETAGRVREVLRAELTSNPGLKEVAARLYLSPRTLHRRLQEEGGSFQAIKDSLRRELAQEWLRKSRRPLAQIASELGFADGTAFYRAFVAWVGQSPSGFRRQK